MKKPSPERIVPENEAKGVVSLHLKRYVFAGKYCKDKIVLDAGCGVGYGSFYLANTARKVIGIDADPTAIGYAGKRYAKKNIDFIAADISERIDFRGAAFDVVCAFEIIEHLTNPSFFLKEVLRVLRAKGIFILSTPYTEKTTTAPNNPFHKIELSTEDLRAMLEGCFMKVELFGQKRKRDGLHRFLKIADIFNLHTRLPLNLVRKLSRVVKNVPFADLTLKDIDIAKDDFGNVLNIIAVCQ